MTSLKQHGYRDKRSTFITLCSSFATIKGVEAIFQTLVEIM
jgi:hypothetical protein